IRRIPAERPAESILDLDGDTELRLDDLTQRTGGEAETGPLPVPIEGNPDGDHFVNVETGECETDCGVAIADDPETASHGLLPAPREEGLAELPTDVFSFRDFIQEASQRPGGGNWGARGGDLRDRHESRSIDPSTAYWIISVIPDRAVCAQAGVRVRN